MGHNALEVHLSVKAKMHLLFKVDFSASKTLAGLLGVSGDRSAHGGSTGSGPAPIRGPGPESQGVE